MANIAKRAGVSVATLYVYYADKQAMLSAVYLEIKALFDDDLMQPQGGSLSLETCLKLTLRTYARLICAHPKEAAVMQIFNHNPELVTAETFQLAMAHAKPLQDLYQQGVQTGILRDTAPEILIAFSFSAFDSLQERRSRDQQLLSEVEIETIIEMS